MLASCPSYPEQHDTMVRPPLSRPGFSALTDIQQTRLTNLIGMWEFFFFFGFFFLPDEQPSRIPTRSCQRILYNKDEAIAAVSVCSLSESLCTHAKMVFPGQEGGAAEADVLNYQVLLLEC